jgi:hypothetical protein
VADFKNVLLQVRTLWDDLYFLLYFSSTRFSNSSQTIVSTLLAKSLSQLIEHILIFVQNLEKYEMLVIQILYVVHSDAGCAC